MCVCVLRKCRRGCGWKPCAEGRGWLGCAQSGSGVIGVCRVIAGSGKERWLGGLYSARRDCLARRHKDRAGALGLRLSLTLFSRQLCKDLTRDPESTTLQPLSAPRERQGNKGHSQPPGAPVPAATQKNSRRTPFTVTLPQDLPPPSSAQPPPPTLKHQAQDASAPPRLPGGSQGCSCWAGGIPGELGGAVLEVHEALKT